MGASVTKSPFCYFENVSFGRSANVASVLPTKLHANNNKKECVLVDTSDSPMIDYMFMFPTCSCLKLFDAMLIPCDMSGGCRLRWVHRLQMTSPHQDGSFRIFWPHVCKKGGGGDVSSTLMGLSQQARLVNVCSVKTPPWWLFVSEEKSHCSLNTVTACGGIQSLLVLPHVVITAQHPLHR